MKKYAVAIRKIVILNTLYNSLRSAFHIHNMRIYHEACSFYVIFNLVETLG